MPALDDVLVVGARCAGASTAMLLARAGLRVRLVDRSPRLGDVLSGHMIKPSGAARLRAWGLLEAVAATGCAPISAGTLWLDGQPHRLPPPPPGSAAPIAPRRAAFDPLLLGAARDAGVTIQLGQSVTDLLITGERVAGVRTSAGDYRARLVVGADGRRSRVAELVGAAYYSVTPPMTYAYYTYWTGTAIDALHVWLEPGLFIGMFPTNHGNAVAFLQAPHAGFDAVRHRARDHYRATFTNRPALTGLLSGGMISERLRGTADLPNFFRTSAGPGWVLAGDAGHHKDPLIARGISDALRDAELIAAAALHGWDADLDTSLQHYPTQRDAGARPLSDANIHLARLDAPTRQRAAAWLRIIELERSLEQMPPAPLE